MNAAMIRNTCKMWYIWRGTDLLFSTEFATIQVTALRRGNSVGKGRMFCAEYDPGHDARQPVAADRIVCCPCAAQPDISAALQHGGYADRRPFPRRRGAGGCQFVRTADFPAHQLLCGRDHGRKRHHFALFRRWRPRPCFPCHPYKHPRQYVQRYFADGLRRRLHADDPALDGN